jgi:hypothetical protein
MSKTKRENEIIKEKKGDGKDSGEKDLPERKKKKGGKWRWRKIKRRNEEEKNAAYLNGRYVRWMRNGGQCERERLGPLNATKFFKRKKQQHNNALV